MLRLWGAGSDSYSFSESSISTSSDDEKLLPPWQRTLETDSGFTEFCVADLDLAEFGRKEIGIAEKQSPGLMVSLSCRCGFA